MSDAYDENKELDQALTLLEVARGLLNDATREVGGDYLRNRERNRLLADLKAEAREVAYRVDRIAGEVGA